MSKSAEMPKHYQKLKKNYGKILLQACYFKYYAQFLLDISSFYLASAEFTGFSL